MKSFSLIACFAGLFFVAATNSIAAEGEKLTQPPFIELSDPLQSARVALARPISISTKKQTLAGLLSEIAQKGELQIVYDNGSIAAESIDLQMEVAPTYTTGKIRNVLKHLLNAADLTYLPVDDAILVTSKSDASVRLCTRIYPIADLIPASPTEEDFSAMTVLVSTILQEQSWKHSGGPGAAIAHPLSKSLIVTQTADVHDQIVYLFSALRQATRDKDKVVGDGEPAPPKAAGDDKAAAALSAKK